MILLYDHSFFYPLIVPTNSAESLLCSDEDYQTAILLSLLPDEFGRAILVKEAATQGISARTAERWNDAWQQSGIVYRLKYDCYKKLHDDVDDLGDIVNIVKFAMQILQRSLRRNIIPTTPKRLYIPYILFNDYLIITLINMAHFKAQLGIVGITEHSSFYRYFRRVTGIYPQAYKDSIVAP